MNPSDVAETAVVGALVLVSIEPFSRAYVAVAGQRAKTRAAAHKALADRYSPVAALLTPRTGPADAPPAAPSVSLSAGELPAVPADTAPGTAGNKPATLRPVDPVTGQMLRADGSNKALDALRARVVAERNGAAG